MAEDLEAEDFELKEYSFTPSVFDKNGKKVIDYTGIEHNKVYLVNRKDILTNPRPSWIPEFDKDGLIADDFLPVCVKDSDGYYYVQSKLEKKDEVIEKAGGRSHKREEWECRYYKMSLDLLSATIDYYLKYRREELRKQQYDARVSLPRSQKTITINRYYDIAELLRFCDKYKDEIDVLTEKYKSQSFYNKGYVRQNQVIFKEQWQPLLDAIKDKRLDLNLSKTEYIESHAKGRETAYGDTGCSDILKEQYGIRLKKQNGKPFQEKQIKRVKASLDKTFSFYGNIKSLADKENIKLSYADNCMQYCMKAIGVWAPYENTIGVSFFDDAKQEKTAGINHTPDVTMIHETAHWLDSLKGRETENFFASDKEGTAENEIAKLYKSLVREKNSTRSSLGSAKPKKLGEYWYRTCECFARAMEQTYAYSQGIDLSKEAGYLSNDVFEKEILPKTNQLINENKKHFSLNKYNTVNKYKVYENNNGPFGTQITLLNIDEENNKMIELQMLSFPDKETAEKWCSVLNSYSSALENDEVIDMVRYCQDEFSPFYNKDIPSVDVIKEAMQKEKTFYDKCCSLITVENFEKDDSVPYDIVYHLENGKKYYAVYVGDSTGGEFSLYSDKEYESGKPEYELEEISCDMPSSMYFYNYKTEPGLSLIRENKLKIILTNMDYFRNLLKSKKIDFSDFVTKVQQPDTVVSESADKSLPVDKNIFEAKYELHGIDENRKLYKMWGTTELGRFLDNSEPDENTINQFNKWLKEHNEDYLRLYHGTASSNDEDIQKNGIKKTTQTRRKSYQSTPGYVYLSRFPSTAKTFGEMNNPSSKTTVYACDIKIKELSADLDQLNNKRSVGIDSDNSLAASLIIGNGARIGRVIKPYEISPVSFGEKNMNITSQNKVEEQDENFAEKSKNIILEELVLERNCNREEASVILDKLYSLFSISEAVDRAHALRDVLGNGFENFKIGTVFPERGLSWKPGIEDLENVFGIYDKSINYHTVWDRLWAVTHSLPKEDVAHLIEWDYSTGKSAGNHVYTEGYVPLVNTKVKSNAQLFEDSEINKELFVVLYEGHYKKNGKWSYKRKFFDDPKKALDFYDDSPCPKGINTINNGFESSLGEPVKYLTELINEQNVNISEIKEEKQNMAKEQKCIAKWVDKDGRVIDFERFSISDVKKIEKQCIELNADTLVASKDTLINFDFFKIFETQPDGTNEKIKLTSPSDLYLQKVAKFYEKKHEHLPTEDEYDAARWNEIMNKRTERLEQSVEKKEPFSFFVKDRAEFEMFADFEPVTNLTAHQAFKKLLELEDKGYSAGIGIHIPDDYIFDDPEGNGCIIFEKHNDEYSFYIGDNFVKELKHNENHPEHASNVINAYKALDSVVTNYRTTEEGKNLPYKEPLFLYEKEKELFGTKNIGKQNVISSENIKLNNISKDELGFYTADLFVPDAAYIEEASISKERFAMPVATWKENEPNITIYMVKRLITEPHNKENEFLDSVKNGNPSVASEEKWDLIREQKIFDIIGEQIEQYNKDISEHSASSSTTVEIEPAALDVDLSQEPELVEHLVKNNILASETNWTADKEKLEEIKKTDRSNRPGSSIWGKVDSCHKMIPGVYTVDTSGHGGIMVHESVASKILSKDALDCAELENGFYQYEEDVDAHIPLIELYKSHLCEGFSWNKDKQGKFFVLGQQSLAEYRPEYLAGFIIRHMAKNEIENVRNLINEQKLSEKPELNSSENVTEDESRKIKFFIYAVNEEKAAELKEHLKNNSYNVSWEEHRDDTMYYHFTADYDSFEEIKTILEDRNIDYEYMLGLLSTGYDAVWLEPEEQMDAEIVTEDEFKRINELREKEFNDLHLPYIKFDFTEGTDSNHKPANIHGGTVLGFKEGIELIDKLNKKFNTFLKADVRFHMWNEEAKDYVEYDPSFEFNDDKHTLENGKEVTRTQESIVEFVRMVCPYPEVLELFEKTWDNIYAPSVSQEQKDFVKELTQDSFNSLEKSYKKGFDELKTIVDEDKEIHSSWIIDAGVSKKSKEKVSQKQSDIASYFATCLEHMVTRVDMYLEDHPEMENKDEFTVYARQKIKDVMQNVKYNESRNAQYGEHGYTFDFSLWRKANEQILDSGDYDAEMDKIFALKEESRKQTMEYAQELKNSQYDFTALADLICQSAYEQSGSGFNYYMSFDVIASLAGKDETWVKENIHNICEALEEHNDELLLDFNEKDALSEDGEIDLNFCSVGEDENYLFKQNDDGRWVRRTDDELRIIEKEEGLDFGLPEENKKVALSLQKLFEKYKSEEKTYESDFVEYAELIDKQKLRKVSLVFPDATEFDLVGLNGEVIYKEGDVCNYFKEQDGTVLIHNETRNLVFGMNESDYNTAVIETPQILKEGSTYSLSLKQLFSQLEQNNGLFFFNDKKCVSLSSGSYIEFKEHESESPDNVYYDMYSKDGDLLCCDGETVAFRGYTENGLLKFECLSGDEKVFILSKEEFETATFTSGIQTEIAKENPVIDFAKNHVDLNKFLTAYHENYDLYYKDIEGETRNEQYLHTELFDFLMKNSNTFKEFVSEVAMHRKDFFSSDRECSAFMRTFRDMGILREVHFSDYDNEKAADVLCVYSVLKPLEKDYRIFYFSKEEALAVITGLRANDYEAEVDKGELCVLDPQLYEKYEVDLRTLIEHADNSAAQNIKAPSGKLLSEIYSELDKEFGKEPVTETKNAEKKLSKENPLSKITDNVSQIPVSQALEKAGFSELSDGTYELDGIKISGSFTKSDKAEIRIEKSNGLSRTFNPESVSNKDIGIYELFNSFFKSGFLKEENCPNIKSFLETYTEDKTQSESIPPAPDFMQKENTKTNRVELNLTPNGKNLSVKFEKILSTEERKTISEIGFAYSTISQSWKAEFNQENGNNLLLAIRTFWPGEYASSLKQMGELSQSAQKSLNLMKASGIQSDLPEQHPPVKRTDDRGDQMER